jgi:hypothetical protein
MKDIKAAAKASHARKAHSVTHGGFKHGSTHAGHRAHGGEVHSDAAADAAQIKRMVKPSALKRADGGHIPGEHKSHKPAGGGKAHTVINVHTGSPTPPAGPMVPPMGALPIKPPMPPVGGPPPGMPPAGLGALGAAPGGPPPGMPPMRKEGGKVGHHMHAGAGGGEGRIEKKDWYGDRKRGGRS